jgi:hypothetical protein
MADRGKSMDDLEREWRAVVAAADTTGIEYDVRLPAAATISL